MIFWIFIKFNFATFVIILTCGQSDQEILKDIYKFHNHFDLTEFDCVITQDNILWKNYPQGSIFYKYQPYKRSKIIEFSLIQTSLFLP